MIGHQAQRQNLPEEPRTTVVACLIQDGYAHWSFVGDSRLYLVRGGRVVTRTRDHTPVQRLIDMGRIREEAAMTHPDRNKLLQCLGGPRAPIPETPQNARLDQGDLVILCSDGFWGPLTQRQLLMGLIGKDMPAALAGLANLSETLAGARCDNVTVLAAEWQEKAVAVPQDPTVPIHLNLNSKPS
jgi:serine/threonine protein phosphatase PrpC